MPGQYNLWEDGDPCESEQDLQDRGFTPEEIAAVLWLRNWYQQGGSDRAEVLRYWEFIRLLVDSGKMEV